MSITTNHHDFSGVKYTYCFEFTHTVTSVILYYENDVWNGYSYREIYSTSYIQYVRMCKPGRNGPTWPGGGREK